MGVDFAEKSARIMVYTRKTDERLYPDGLARSIHLAYSRDGENYEAMNGNYGILFAEGTLDKNDTICPKGVEAPRVFPMPGGGFGITAFRVNENGSADEEMCIRDRCRTMTAGSPVSGENEAFLCFSRTVSGRKRLIRQY